MLTISILLIVSAWYFLGAINFCESKAAEMCEALDAEIAEYNRAVNNGDESEEMAEWSKEIEAEAKKLEWAIFLQLGPIGELESRGYFEGMIFSKN